jgi:hypothetical protein
MQQRLARMRRRLAKFAALLQNKDRFLATAWCLRHGTGFETWARAIDPVLWYETLDIARRIQQDAARVIPGLPITGGQARARGGGGCDVRKLYFLARRVKPNVIVETGVSAGYSSRAFLEAIRANGCGRLYSSDLPVLLEKSQVGCLVPASLRESWRLYYEGDAVNLPQILSEVRGIDLFHYDSAKAIAAKEQVFAAVRPHLTANSVVIVDDIDRDSFFSTLVPVWKRDFFVFRTVGVLGLNARLRDVNRSGVA